MKQIAVLGLALFGLSGTLAGAAGADDTGVMRGAGDFGLVSTGPGDFGIMRGTGDAGIMKGAGDFGLTSEPVTPDDAGAGDFGIV